MFEQKFIANAIERSAENRLDRRRFLRATGIAGIGVGAASLLGAPAASAAEASAADSGAPSDAAILNFALNLEYLEAEFYSIATTGSGLDDSITNGTGTKGAVTGGRKVAFSDPNVRQFAQEIAKDEKEHVVFLRTALGSAAVARPAISLDASFKAAAKAAGLGDNFDPYASDVNFLLGAFVFEDVGVTAYKGAAPLISNTTYLGAAAGILAVEAYHAALIRKTLFSKGVDAQSAAGKISGARGSLDGVGSDDQGILVGGTSNIVPSDSNGLAFARTPGHVLNIVYLNPAVVTKGGFFPAGVNGALNQSGGGSPSSGSTSSSSPSSGSTSSSSTSSGSTSGAAAGMSAVPSGGAATGAGSTAGGRNSELLVGGAVAAVGAAAAAGKYQHGKKAIVDGPSADAVTGE